MTAERIRTPLRALCENYKKKDELFMNIVHFMIEKGGNVNALDSLEI